MLQRFPFILGIISMVGGVFIAILFGANEEIFKDRIQNGLKQNVKIQAMQEGPDKVSKIASEAEKNWRYYQRYHFHATGIGAMILCLLIFLVLLDAPAKFVTVTSYLIAIGGFLYPFVWLFAGIYGPEMGRSEAKEAFALLGYMGGLFLVGGVFAAGLGLKYPMKSFSR